jgi:long-subunit fatty acid transport protein
VDFADFMTYSATTVNNGLDMVNAGIAQYQAMGIEPPAELLIQQAQLEGTKESLTQLQKYAQGVNLLCNQDGLGVAPVIGVDWKFKNFNFAAKYEFKTQLRMKNESTVNEASAIDAVNKYRDGEKVNEDMPALLTIGAQWKPIDAVSLNLGWHHYFDKDASWYNNSQDLLKHNTNEFLAGVEWDITDKLNVSCGGQLTRYGLTDDYMNDISFVVNSYSIGLGASYKVAEKVTLSAAYFQTNYSNYEKTVTENLPYKDTYTRTNRVLGLGVQVDF